MLLRYLAASRMFTRVLSEVDVHYIWCLVGIIFSLHQRLVQIAG